MNFFYHFVSVYILLLVFLVLGTVYFFLGNPNLLGRIVSWSLGVCPVFAVGEHVPVGKKFLRQVDQSQCSTRVQF